MTQISDHAVLRYLERAYGLDVDAIRAEMNTPALTIAEAFGCGAVVGKHGVRLMIRNGCVTTVLPKRYRRRARQ